MEPSSAVKDDDDGPEWPLHQRLSGVAARTMAVGLAILPAVALLANEVVDAAMTIALSLVFACPLLAAERRDLGLLASQLRLLLASAVGLALVPVALVSFLHVGKPPDAAYAEMGRLIDWRMAISVLIGAPVASLLLGGLFAVRARTSRVGPQVLAGLMIPVLMFSGWIEQMSWSDRLWKVVGLLVLTGALVPLALAGAERVMASRDPRAPRPTERDPRGCFAVFGATLLLLSLLPALGAQAMREMFTPDFDEPGQTLVAEHANALRALGAQGVRWTSIADWMNEPRSGHLLRVVVAAEGARWCVVADPLDPSRAHEGSWIGDHTGALLSYASPVAVDARACTAPPGGRP